jgi:hypothetical protein
MTYEKDDDTRSNDGRGMLAGFVDRIAELATMAAGGRTLGSTSDARGRIPYWDGSKVEWYEPFRPVERLAVCGVRDVAVAAVRFATDHDVFERVEARPETVVVVSPAGIEARREYPAYAQARAAFGISAPFARLCALAANAGFRGDQSPGAMTPGDAVRMLRLELDSVAGAELAAALSRVDFARTSSGAVVTEHGRESLGRSVEARAQGVSAIPSRIKVSVPVFQLEELDDIVETVDVEVVLHPNAGKVELVPLRESVARAIARARDRAHSRVEGAVRDEVGRLGEEKAAGVSIPVYRSNTPYAFGKLGVLEPFVPSAPGPGE